MSNREVNASQVKLGQFQENSCGMNTREGNASQVNLGHFQESSRALKKWLASTMNDIERCSSVKLALASALPKEGDGIRVGEHLYLKLAG